MTGPSNIVASDGLGPPDGRAWDLVVIGGGTAGLVAATTAAGFGASVLMVERARTGGDCLWTGCVPSKALLAAAHAAADARAAGRLGIRVDGVRVDFPAVMAHVRAAIAAIEPDDSPATLRAAGVQVHRGRASFTGPRTVEVDAVPVPFRQAVLATGSAPTVPPLPGLDSVRHWTNETVFDLREQPERLVVLGGGPIGCELGQAFARLGSTVTLVHSGERLLPAEERDASAIVTSALAADGVDIRTSVSVSGVSSGRAGLSDGTSIPLTDLLVAVGRTPRTAGLGLERAGIDTDQKGNVEVDGGLRTSNARVWAAGDVTAHSRFTHTAGMHGSLAASNAVLGLRRKFETAAVPRVTYTHPEVAAVGLSGEEGVTVRTVAHDEVDRAVAEQQTAGFSRLVLDRGGRIVGATIVGPRAGESLAEVVLAIRQGAHTRHLAATTHAYPTWSDGVWNAAVAQVRANLATPLAGRTTAALTTTRRWWLDR